MKINNIQNTDFQGKEKAKVYLSKGMQKDIQKLMYEMNHDTKYEQSANGNCFKSYILGAIMIDKKALFMDKRFLCAPTDKIRTFKNPDCTIEFGHNAVDINSQTGEVFARKKYFWKSLTKVLEQGHSYIKSALENYNNAEVVEKRTLGICGVTQKGAAMLEGAKKKAGLG